VEEKGAYCWGATNHEFDEPGAKQQILSGGYQTPPGGNLTERRKKTVGEKCRKFPRNVPHQKKPSHFPGKLEMSDHGEDSRRSHGLGGGGDPT